MIHEYWTNRIPNVHPSVYQKLIQLWNCGPRHYRNYLRSWGFTHGQCEKILDKIEEWVKLQSDQYRYENNLYINEY